MNCKNCGHLIWKYQGDGEWVHRMSNRKGCSGDNQDIEFCPCTNPEPKTKGVD